MEQDSNSPFRPETAAPMPSDAETISPLSLNVPRSNEDKDGSEADVEVREVGDFEKAALVSSEEENVAPPQKWLRRIGVWFGKSLLFLLKSPWLLLKGIAWLLRKLWQATRWSGLGLLRLSGFKRIDRYILGKFLSTYLFLIAIIITIAIIFDFNEKIDLLSKAPWREVVLDYYANFVPYFSNMFSPLFVFIGVIFFTTKLASNSEIIAMKAAGFSFRRLLRPYMFGSFLIATTSFFLGAYVIPKGNVARVKFENLYTKKIQVIDVSENIQMQVDTGVVAFISHFDNRTKSGSGFSLDKFEAKKVVSRLTAETIQYDTLADHKYSWTLYRYMIRTLTGNREKITTGEKLDTTIIMEPKDFFYIKGAQETMTVPELSTFIDRQRLRGAAGIAAFEVEYHKRFATPLAAFILTLIGVSISIQKRKGGMGTSIGIGLALTFTYILFQTIAASFAINSGWPAGISVWLPNILFAIIAFWFYKRSPQ